MASLIVLRMKKSAAKQLNLGTILSPAQMTQYCLRHRLRNSWGLMDEEEIKQTISYAADYWRLEEINLKAFDYIADPEYRNRSVKAHPILHYLNSYRGEAWCEVLDGLHRIGMARALRKRKMLAWIGHLNSGST